ncbi:MAG: 50S ribosomal protein L17, partial [Chloroflexi bacterium]|nr:50S ribosomal protein L17 [Chloroflexota bacterium]
MRHKVSGRNLGRDSGHRKALYRNLVTDILGYESITTTEAKAKEV